MRLIGGSWNPATISTSCHLWLPHRRAGIECKHLHHAKAPRSTGASPYSDLICESAHALADAIQHNLQDPNNPVRDEGTGFDSSTVPDPTFLENLLFTHRRGIYLMKTLVDEVSFEEGGAVVMMRKKSNASSAEQRNHNDQDISKVRARNISSRCLHMHGSFAIMPRLGAKSGDRENRHSIQFLGGRLRVSSWGLCFRQCFARFSYDPS